MRANSDHPKLGLWFPDWEEDNGDGPSAPVHQLIQSQPGRRFWGSYGLQKQASMRAPHFGQEETLVPAANPFASPGPSMVNAADRPSFVQTVTRLLSATGPALNISKRAGPSCSNPQPAGTLS